MSVIQKEILDRLDTAIEKIGTSKDYYVRKINKKLARYIEDIEDLAIAREQSAEIEAGAKTYTLEEVLKENGLSDKVQ